MNTLPASDRTATQRAPSHQEITSRARALWIECGEPAGRDDEIWYEAERRLFDKQPLPRTGASLLPSPAPEAAASSSTAVLPPPSERLGSRGDLLSEKPTAASAPAPRHLSVRTIASTSAGLTNQPFSRRPGS